MGYHFEPLPTQQKLTKLEQDSNPSHGSTAENPPPRVGQGNLEPKMATEVWNLQSMDHKAI